MDVEQKARELLADEFARMGGVSAKYVEEVRKGIAGPWDCAAIGAIIAALTPPEGYVLVPVEPTEDMTWAPSDVEVGYPSWAGSRDCCTTDEAKAVWAAMLAARSKVTP